MTIKKALTLSTQKLRSKDINSASLDAEVLLSFIIQKPKEFLYTQPDHQLTKVEQKKFEKLINKRRKFEPVAYLTGYKEFYGNNFKINKHVFVPRPESEKIINLAFEVINNRFAIRDSCLPAGKARFAICDIGTGSGCLIISLAKKLKEQKLIDELELYATDISLKALKVAKQNAKLHQVDKYITFLKGDLLKPLKNKRIDLIITNLPYLTKADIQKEPSIKKEPRLALVGDYQKLFYQLETLDDKSIIIFEDKQGVKAK